MKNKNKEWILDYIHIKKHGLEYAYCQGDIESAHKIEEDIKALEAMFEKQGTLP